LSRVLCGFLVIAAVFLVGCPKQSQEFDAGRKAEAIEDYDTALGHYDRALRDQPTNVEYKLRALHMRMEDAQFYVELGQKALDAGDLQHALADFQRAQGVDASNSAADQGVQEAIERIAAQNAPQPSVHANDERSEGADLLGAAPELKPLSRDPINLKMTSDTRVIYETIGELAGLSVIFDPHLTPRRVSIELPNVTLEQALDDASLVTKNFWKPLTGSVIFVAPDNPEERRALEDEEIETFYLCNTLTPQDLTEIVTGLRELLDLHRIDQVNAQNAIVIRDTPDKLALAAKIIRDSDQAKPEVLIHIQVLTANRDRLRDLGILPSQSVSVIFSPRCSLMPSSADCTSSSSSAPTGGTGASSVTLSNLKNLSTSDYSLTLPGATASAVLTDNKTRVIQDPEVRVADGEKATLKIGQRVPIATNSLQIGAGGLNTLSSLIDTQFTYQDVGVNITVTPHVHFDGDVSLKLTAEISSLAGSENIGGVTQPIISSASLNHDVRLKDGEVGVLGALIERTETRNLNGIPGVSQVPGLGSFIGDNSTSIQDDELLIVLTPHVIRFPSIKRANLETIAAGTETKARVYHDRESPLPAAGLALPSSARP
jgi:general secretion pathway protein D